MRQRNGDHFLPTGKALKQTTTLQAVLLVVSVVSVFAVISIWAPVGILLVILLIIAFAGGVLLGKMGAILVSFTTMVVIVRAEIVSMHPLRPQTLLFGVGALVIVLGGVGLSGSLVRLVLRRHLNSRRQT
jgi:hypothetical protein